MTAYSVERLKRAGSRFKEFFAELSEVFVEREDLLLQIQLALLAREHVLMTGPPGTAKSKLASAVLGRIIDEETGDASLFARQFTESTVQTDLVGPIDFKTLMETGRTEHFTDEGMLGAAHAFLDEVFDGRDMLLRSTLNVLHERELKQGTRVTRGDIECAVMTTNRYLCEILEGSRETLLAFVDRVAFLNFVPKGFAEPESLNKILRAQVAGEKPRPLSALLTIQDLDLLQAAADSVFVSDELCERLGEFVRSLETEFAAARRADPSFVPARYFSTRTIVRLGKIIRAACVFAWISGHNRGFIASRDDLRYLRLSLLLSGPSFEALPILERAESDPRELRQLSLIRTEREIFERCLEKLPPPRPSRRPPPIAPTLLDATRPERLGDKPDDELLTQTQALAVAATAGDTQAGTAREHLSAAVQELTRRAFAHGLGTVTSDNLSSLVVTATELGALADNLEKANPERRSVASWLRGRALEMVVQALEQSPVDIQSELDEVLSGPFSIDNAQAATERRLERLSKLVELGSALRSAGASESDPERGKLALLSAHKRVEDALVVVWDELLQGTVVSAFSTVTREALNQMLLTLAEPLGRMSDVAAKLSDISGHPSTLKDRVVGPRLAPFVKAAFERFDTTDRSAVTAQVESVLQVLRQYGLEHALAPVEILTWSAEALLRAETQTSIDIAHIEASYQGYRTLRNAEQRTSLVFVLAEICLRITPEVAASEKASEEVMSIINARLSELPSGILERVLRQDLTRIERSVSFLERYWAALQEPQTNPAAMIERFARSRFFSITTEEAALSRFGLEARLLAASVSGADVVALLDRIASLDAVTTRTVRELLALRATNAWNEVLNQSRS